VTDFLLSLGRRERKRDDALRVPPLVFIERTWMDGVRAQYTYSGLDRWKAN
jgi:hypothetical protein